MNTSRIVGLLLGSVMGLSSLSGCKEKKQSNPAVSPASASARANPSSAPPPKPAPVVAPALAPPAETAKLDNPPASEPLVPEIPEGRSKPPTLSEWQAAAELNTQEPNSRAENCQMKVVREWLKVYCHGDISGFSDMSEFGEKTKDYFASLRKGKSADFVVRLRRGKTMRLKIQRGDAREAVLYMSWPEPSDRPAHIALGRGKPPEKAAPEPPQAEKQKKKSSK